MTTVRTLDPISNKIPEVDVSLEEDNSTLKSYQWPGNVRELQHTIERAVIMTNNDKIEVEDLSLFKKSKSKKNIDESMSLDEIISIL